MTDWLAARPDANEAWNIGDGRIRTNFAFLEAALQQISTFAINPANPTDRMIGRVIAGNLVDRPVMTLTQQTGAIFYAQDTTQVFICVNGIGNLWGELGKFGGPVIFGGGVSFIAAVTFNTAIITAAITALGLIQAVAGMTVSGGATILGPSAQQWLVNNAGTPQTMDPLKHGGRHQPGGTDGVWAVQNDPIPFAIQRVLATASILHGNVIDNAAASIDVQTFGATGIAKASIAFSTVGRPSTSRFLLYAEYTTVVSASGHDYSEEEIQGLAYLDATGVGNRIGAKTARYFDDDVTNSQGRDTRSLMRFVTGVSAATHEIALQLWSNSSVAPSVESLQMILIDLGLE